MKTLLNIGILLGTVLLFLPYILKGVLMLSTALLPVDQPEICSTDLTKPLFESLETTMTLTNIQTRIGCKPTKVVHSPAPDKMSYYTWRDANGDEIYVTASEGIVITVGASGGGIIPQNNGDGGITGTFTSDTIVSP